MKILHTSDWHIGKKLMGKERLDEQREVLCEIQDIADREGVELVLVAGDVFDTFTPSAQAEDLFYEKIKDIAKGRAVLIISGNHDDHVRLCAGSPLAEEQNIYLVGDNTTIIKCNSLYPVHPVSSGEGYVIFENGEGERVYINTLPYPNEARFHEEKTDESYIDVMKRWLEKGNSANTQGLPTIILSHLFVLGGETSDGEREIDLGGARAISPSVFPKNDYVALGHLHKKQYMGANVQYSGSILEYSFDESGTEKYVITFDIGKNGVQNKKEIQLKKGRKLSRIQANSVEDAIVFLKRAEGSFVELTLNLTEPLSHSDITLLKQANPLLISIRPIVESSGESFSVSKKEWSASELFKAYYKERFSEEVGDDILSLFLELTEVEDEA